MLTRFDPIQPALTKPFHRDGWVYEEKYDGWRVVAYKHGRHVRLVSQRAVSAESHAILVKHASGE
jgi:ATP-dependent DNA ligase